jgi:pyruvate, orthophosphate dikinase
MSGAATAYRWLVPFAEGGAEMRALLGNKGANLAEMTRVLGRDRVPGGFTITTEACAAYMGSGVEGLAGFDAEIEAAVAAMEEEAGLGFGDPGAPLLLSVRSGAPVSMPGMLDTVLNLGLSEEATHEFARRSGNAHLAWDSRRRLVQMYAEVVRAADPVAFERELVAARRVAGVQLDSELGPDALRGLARRFAEIYRDHTGEPFPEDPRDQLRAAVHAVFDSWRNERARTYRRLNGIPDDLGTAVTVQRMVFGNRGKRSGSGVAFTRDPTTGEPHPEGDFLSDAQGEDVVAGVRDTEGLDGLERRLPRAHAELVVCLARLERHYRDIQDVEYTVEDGRLYVLQTRSAKRHAQAAVRFAVDAVGEGMLSREEAMRTINPGSLGALLHPAFDPDAEYEVLTRGVAASPGAAKGAIVFAAADAEERTADGEDVILVRPFTSADDVAGFDAAVGILTQQGGKSSHAAIVARGMGRPCVCGASELDVDASAGVVRVGDRELVAGDRLVIDGSTGVVTADDVDLVSPPVDDEFAEVLRWADELRRLGVRANADTPADAARARELGADGIGLCRTEHMFFGGDREALVRELFIGQHDDEDFSRLLERLGAIQQEDFTAILQLMAGLPVTIRLLDPPLHEFVPVQGFERELRAAESGGDAAAIERARTRLAAAEKLEEVNPMLGTRGARLGLTVRGLYEMQACAIARAAVEVSADGGNPRVEIMLPLIAYEKELAELRRFVESSMVPILEQASAPISIPIGTMIELPRACLAAAEIGRHADFFSFGTNDLTQTALGMSRDDAESGFLPDYLDRGLVARDPFETIDREGVGELVSIAVKRGRDASPDLHCGVCGEHAGDPESIGFFHAVDIDYVSCSAFRVPVARVAAALAAIG